MAFLVRRLLQVIPTLLVVVVLSFMLVNAVPGDPAYILAGGLGGDPEYFAMMRERMGLHLPLFVRLINYLGSLARGDLGQSIAFHQPVIVLIGQRIPNSLLLGVPAIVISSVLGISLGVWSALRQNKWQDSTIIAGSILGYSIPLFWLGQLLITLFAVHLHWLPTGGIREIGTQATSVAALIDFIRHLLLPALTFAVYQLALITRITRAGMIEVLRQDYIRVAYAKGLSSRTVVFKHALRNALLPVVTVVGANMAFLLAGIVVIESVFAWPGMGRLAFEAVLNRDYPLLLGVFLVSSLGVVIANLVTDIAYMALDPRVVYY